MNKAEKARDRHYQRTYGITLNQYNKILRSQGGVCAICKSLPKQRNLAVDHNHVSLEIRGLLCWSCNRRLIGNRTDPELYRQAAIYLDHHTGLFVPKNPKRRKRRKK